MAKKITYSEETARSIQNWGAQDPRIYNAEMKRWRAKWRAESYEYEVQGNYGHGWECETTEDTMSEARKRLKEYRVNVPEYSHRIKRVKVLCKFCNKFPRIKHGNVCKSCSENIPL